MKECVVESGLDINLFKSIQKIVFPLLYVENKSSISDSILTAVNPVMYVQAPSRKDTSCRLAEKAVQ